jgi:hypothetical protein
MGLLDKLVNDGSTLSEFDGATPTPVTMNDPQSTLHNAYSINGNPSLTGFPTPSTLDLNGVTPPKYLDNPPQ